MDKNTIIYNKLIRDNIPEIINKDGKECVVEELNDDDYIVKLKEKLIEEANEVNNANADDISSELADVLEIIEAIENHYKLDHNDILNIKENKSIKNGKFNKKLLLKEVTKYDK